MPRTKWTPEHRMMQQRSCTLLQYWERLLTDDIGLLDRAPTTTMSLSSHMSWLPSPCLRCIKGVGFALGRSLFPISLSSPLLASYTHECHSPAIAHSHFHDDLQERYIPVGPEPR
eukprot:4055753-Amphidinium_carterae.1